jgi:4-amino-4-deoxy-L-arabinose transferase-like glycosyltransferase
MRSGHRLGEALFVVAAQAAVLFSLAVFRFVDGDEGVYAYASRLAVHGHVPYRDFFYEQAPLLPYVYGPIGALTGESWYALRGLSVAFAVLAGLLLYWFVQGRQGRGAAFAAVAVYAGSGLVFGYLTLVKTYSLTVALVFAAFVLASRGSWPAAGLLLALAVDARLLLLALVPVFLVGASRARQAAGFGAGLVMGLVPTLLLLAISPRAFLFDNVRYHSLKSSAGLVGDGHQKAQTAATLLGLEPTDRALGIQFGLLVLAAVLALVWAARRRRLPLALGIAVALGVVSFLPTPSYVQYFALAVPFLIVGALELRPPPPLLAVFAVAYLVPAIWAVRHFVSYDPLLRPSLGSVREVAARVDAASAPGERVLSSWPGYLIGTHAWTLPDYPNQFAPVAAAKISPSAARRYHVASEPELEHLIRERRVRLVVYRNWVTSPPFARWDGALRGGRYHLVARVQTAAIYTRR